MRRKFLVIEDQLHRFEELKRAVEHCRTDYGHEIELDCTPDVGDVLDDRPLDQTNGRSFPVDRLARYDGFFVDFRLGSDRFKNVGYFDLGSPLGQRREVEVMSGVGVMLYLRQVFTSGAYVRARTTIIGSRSTRPLPAPLFSFTLLEELPTQFFAPAVQSWFGAQHFEAHRLDRAIAHQLHLVVTGELATKDRASVEVTRAVPAFDRLMDTIVAPRSARTWNHRPDDSDRVIDEMYDWLGLYLAAPGKRGGLQGFIDEATKTFGVRPDWGEAANQYAPPVIEMQMAVAEYLDQFKTGCKWIEQSGTWKLGDRQDHLWDTLNSSREFWTQSDVRVALSEHRARSNAASRSGASGGPGQ